MGISVQQTHATKYSLLAYFGRENKKRSFVDEFIVRKPHEEQLEDDDKRDQGWFGARNSNKDDETDNASFSKKGNDQWEYVTE